MMMTTTTTTTTTTAHEISEALRRRERVADPDFDRFMPAAIAARSALFWTPLAVVARAVVWLDELGLDDVVDLGSGAGKLCVAAALMHRGRFHGVEHRPALVDAARALAATFGVADRATFELGVLAPGTLPRAAVYYLYNPFGENIAPAREHFDEGVELGDDRHARDVEGLEAFFAEAPAGTHVLVYNGFGGRMPPRYASLRSAFDLPSTLRLWGPA